MNRASQILLLCEDAAHERFVRRFLKTGWGVKNRMLRLVPYPTGGGSGARHVENKLPEQVKALRRRSASTILFVVRDADNREVAEVRRTLEELCPENARSSDEAIVFVIPRWHIETWFFYLDTGKQPDESNKRDYKAKYGDLVRSKDAHSIVDKLSTACKANETLPDPPASLAAACEEFERARQRLM